MQNIFTNTKKVHIWSDTWICSLRFFLAGSILLKLKRKCSRNRPKTFLKCSRIIFSQIWQNLQQIFCWKNLVLLLIYWQNIITWGKDILSRRFLGGFLVVFLQFWMFCNLVRCLQIFVQIILQRNFCCKNFFYKCAQMCAKKIVCQIFVRLCAKLFLQIIWHSFYIAIFSFFFLQASHAIVE